MMELTRTVMPCSLNSTDRPHNDMDSTNHIEEDLVGLTLVIGLPENTIQSCFCSYHLALIQGGGGGHIWGVPVIIVVVLNLEMGYFI